MSRDENAVLMGISEKKALGYVFACSFSTAPSNLSNENASNKACKDVALSEKDKPPAASRCRGLVSCYSARAGACSIQATTRCHFATMPWIVPRDQPHQRYFFSAFCFSNLPVSHSFTVLSVLPEARVLPFAVNARQWMLSV